MHYMDYPDKKQVPPTFTLRNERFEGDIDLPEDDILLETVNIEGKIRGRSVRLEQKSSAQNIAASTFIGLMNSECRENIQAERIFLIESIIHKNATCEFASVKEKSDIKGTLFYNKGYATDKTSSVCTIKSKEQPITSQADLVRSSSTIINNNNGSMASASNSNNSSVSVIEDIKSLKVETNTKIPESKPDVKFISMSGTIATIDGSAKDIRFKSTLLDQESIPLYLARTQSSGFEWNEKIITEVVIKNITIYGEEDIKCLGWFIKKGIKINASASIVPFEELSEFTDDINKLVKSNLKAIEGSSITLGWGSGWRGEAITVGARIACESLGFKVGPSWESAPQSNVEKEIKPSQIVNTKPIIQPISYPSLPSKFELKSKSDTDSYIQDKNMFINSCKSFIREVRFKDNSIHISFGCDNILKQYFEESLRIILDKNRNYDHRYGEFSTSDKKEIENIKRILIENNEFSEDALNWLQHIGQNL